MELARTTELTGMSPVLECTGLSRRFGDRVAVDDVHLRIAPGETYGLLGPNGAGKTTTIRMVCGLLTPDAGSVVVAGRRMHGASGLRARELIGYVPKDLPATGELDRTASDRVSRSIDLRLHHREYRVDTRPYGDGTVQAVLDLATDHAQRMQLLRALLITGTTGLLLAAALSAWLARRAVTPLGQALALQRRFVADASHELRTPLTLLSTRAQLIQRSLDHGAGAGALRSDVDGLVQDARQLSAILLISADPREPATTPVELTALVRDAVDAARPAATNAGVSLVMSTVDDRATVPASAAGLRRAVNALLDNAIRHANSEVLARVSAHRGSATIEITDDGPGVDPRLLPTLFDRFAGATTETHRGPRRHGLGLALVNEIAARHGGTIEVGTADGGGARFRLTLPAGAPQRQHFSQDPPAG